MAEKSYKEIMAERWAAETEEQKDSKDTVYQDIIDHLKSFRNPETEELGDEILSIRDDIIFNRRMGEINIKEILSSEDEEISKSKELALNQMIEFFDISRRENTMPYQNVWESYISLTTKGGF